MVEAKPSDQGDQQNKAQEVKPLASSDAQAIATPSAQDKQIAESDRTNQSSGSLTELALKTRGLSREQIAAQMDAQGDSISIDYGNGQEASRKTGLTEKKMVQVGGKTYDANAVVAYDNQGNSGIVSDATNATAIYETDKNKIVPKQVEVQPTQVNAGLDYNKENVPFSQKLANFALSAEARLMDPVARQAYFQGMIDRVIGVGVGLNEVKEEIKDSAKMAASKAITALKDGSVASFMAQPNAINEPLFKTIGICFDAMRKDPNAVNKVLSIMGRELEEANNKYTNMTQYERGVQDGKAMFFFINPSGSTGRAFEVVDSVAAKVDPIVEKAIQDGMKAAEELAKESPEYARKAQKMVLDYARKHRLTPKQLETIGVPNEYLEGVNAPKPTEPIKTSDTINAMSKADDLGSTNPLSEVSSEKTDLAYRGDHDVHSRLNTKGRPKSYINENGDLSPADPVGIYKGQKVTVEEHLAARWCKGAKSHSPYISFGEKDGVLKTFGQGNGLTLDLKSLRRAIGSGEIKGVRLYEHEEVIKAVQESRFHDSIKNRLLTWSRAHKEVVVEGIIPHRFLELGLK